MDEKKGKPTMRILHQMARSGGTLVGKCLGCMRHVTLFSEIHPKTINEMNIIEQAGRWFNLFSPEDLRWMSEQEKIGFGAAVELIRQRCEAQGQDMIIRDWAHADFTGDPYDLTPEYELTTSTYLASGFTVVCTSLTRHPIDQWLSFTRLGMMSGYELDLEKYLYGYLKFAELSREIGFVRYEDVTSEPLPSIQQLCRNLDTECDTSFMTRWAGYAKISGDVYGSGRGDSVIKPIPRREMDENDLKQFKNSRYYHKALDILGYEHPGDPMYGGKNGSDANVDTGYRYAG